MRYLVTSALPYVNGPLHIGHLAGAYLPADLYVRYLRLRGRDVAYICGSDEMGVAIVMRALREETTPQEVVDRYHPLVQESFERLGMSFDHYGRTTSATHRRVVQDFFETLDAAGVFNLRTEEQLYDPEAELFLADRFVKGTCPVCGYEDAYGDQCERCGSALSPNELENPRSVLSGAEPVLRETTHWYLPLGDLQPELEKWLATVADAWKPTVRGQIQSWLNDGLRDRAITRDVPWGVPVPESCGARHGVEVDGKVIYVWFDAPLGYLANTQEWAEEQGEPDLWRRYWQDEESQLIHFIGKDNIVFHGLMFPAMLQAHNAATDGPDFVLPANVPANEFLNLEGQKLSTSRGWAVWLHEYLDDFPPEEGGADLLRYALTTTLPETKDADFSWSDFQSRANDELADVLGNFVHRALTFGHRFFDGEVPPLSEPAPLDQAVLKELADAPARIAEAYDAFRFREAVSRTLDLARLGNKHFNDTEPWKTRKTDPQACANTVHVALQLCASLSLLLEPVVPHAAARLRQMLNLPAMRPSTPSADAADESLGWDDAGRPLLPAGHTLGEAEVLFQKVSDEVIAAQVEKLRERAAEAEEGEQEGPPYEALKDQIVYGDFAKLDLRVGLVRHAEAVPRSNKLLKLDIDLGFEERQVLAGIAQHLGPDEIVGRRVVVVANLKPRTMMGLESQGMVLMAEDREGHLIPVSSEAEVGSTVA